jgi:hypothetical protein
MKKRTYMITMVLALQAHLLNQKLARAYVASWVDTVYFAIDSNASTLGSAPTEDSTPPTINILSIESKTYNTTNIPLTFTVNEETSQVSYSLDGHDNVTITGNSTLTELTIGPHSLTLYARDLAGNTGASQTVDFTIAEEAEPFPAILIATASAASVAVIDLWLLVYVKKRKH